MDTYFMSTKDGFASGLNHSKVCSENFFEKSEQKITSCGYRNKKSRHELKSHTRPLIESLSVFFFNVSPEMEKSLWLIYSFSSDFYLP